jgi:ZIP family zinc transporter
VGALAAGFWGFVGGAALLVGALVGIYAGASRRTIATIMALGAGVLISSVAFELMDEAYQRGGFDASALGLLLGAVAFFVADMAVAALLGYFFLASASEDVVAAIQAFAAGAILTMLASTMMPEAYEEGGSVVGLATAAGFLLSFVLSHLG